MTSTKGHPGAFGEGRLTPGGPDPEDPDRIRQGPRSDLCKTVGMLGDGDHQGGDGPNLAILGPLADHFRG